MFLAIVSEWSMESAPTSNTSSSFSETQVVFKKAKYHKVINSKQHVYQTHSIIKLRLKDLFLELQVSNKTCFIRKVSIGTKIPKWYV